VVPANSGTKQRRLAGRCTLSPDETVAAKEAKAAKLSIGEIP